MFSQIRIQGLGPHDDTTIDLDPEGLTLIEGGSEAGKSTLVEAVCFVLWGAGSDGKPFDVDAIRDGHKSVDVTLTTAKGATLRRRMTRTRRTERFLGDDSFTTEAAFAKKIARLCESFTDKDGANKPKAHYILTPFSWVPLAEGPGNGRPLRDLLAALVPGSDRDEVGRLMKESGHELRSDDVTDSEKIAKDNRADAKKHRARCAGALREAEAAVPEEPAEAETAPDTTEARAVLAAAEAWSTYRAAEAAYADAETAATSWDERRAELGERPKANDAELQKATSKKATLAAQLRHEEEVQRKATQDADAARRALESAERATDPAVEKAEARVAHLRGKGPCPTCGQDRPGADPEALAEAEAALATAQTEAATRRKRELKELRDKVLQHEARVSDAGHKAHIARTALASAETYLDTLKQQAAAVEGYDKALRALGSRPSVPSSPVMPEGAEPTREAVASARETIDQAKRAEGAVEQARKARAAALARVEKARAALEAAEAEVARLEALVEAVRRAPGERLRRGMEALGLEGVSVAVEDTGCKVLVDGRAYKLASKGRRVAADLALRLALRRAARMTWLPIFVDEVQSWSGEWPEADGPLVFLRTTEGPIRVAGQREAA